MVWQGCVSFVNEAGGRAGCRVDPCGLAVRMISTSSAELGQRPGRTVHAVPGQRLDLPLLTAAVELVRPGPGPHFVRYLHGSDGRGDDGCG
jgi:hypothetical protein